MIVLLLLMVTLLLSVTVLVVDGSRLVWAYRQTQNYADAASLAAVQQLRNPNRVQGWQNAKPAALAVLTRASIPFLNTAAQTAIRDQSLQFRNGAATLNDPTGYQNDSAVATQGNLSIRLERGVFCYQGNSRAFLSLEAGGGCDSANGVKVDITLSEVPTYFARMLGQAQGGIVKSSATAVLRDTTGSCTSPVCGNYDTNLTTVGVQLPTTCTSPTPSASPTASPSPYSTPRWNATPSPWSSPSPIPSPIP